MALHRLVFDATDTASQNASANVGAYLRASDGTLLTHTDVSGKKSLDVNVANTLTIDVDLDHTTDSVQIGDGTDFLAINNDGSLNAVVTATNLDIRDLAFATDSVDVSGSSVTVSATDLDIRDLAFATDKVDVSGSSVTVSATNLDIRDLAAATDSVSAWTKDGSGNSISSTSNALHVLLQNSSVAVTATNLDVRDLTHASDSIKIGDGTDFMAVNTNGSINVETTSDPALANTALSAVAETVGTSAVQIVDGGDELANRKYVMIYHNGNKQAYIGQSGVTTSSGFPLPAGSLFEARIGAAVDIFMIADTAGQNIRTLQLS
jgi:hypothetical protein